MNGGRALALSLIVLASAAACGSAPPVPSTSAGPGASPTPSPLADASDCRRRIQATVLTDDTTINAVDECRFVAGGAQVAADVLKAGGTRDVLWAAVWVYGSSGADPAPLRPLLTNADPSIKVMAGAALVRLGDAAGLDGMTSALPDQDLLAGSYPPISIAQFAASTLSRYVTGPGIPPGPGDEAAPSNEADASATPDQAALAAAWQSWLATNRPALTYDRSKGEWSAP